MTSAIRVVLGTDYPFDENHVHGGIEAVALYLTTAMSKRSEIDLHVVSCTQALHHEETEHRGSAIFHWVATRRGLDALRVATINTWKVRRVYDMLKPDVIHVQGFSEYALAARTADRLLLSVHGIEPFARSVHHITHFRGISGLYRRVVTAGTARTSLRKASGIVSNAGGYIPGKLSPWLQGKSIFPIFNPVSDDFFSIQSQEEQTSPTVLWVGEISERKNLTGLVEAFALVMQKVPEACLQIVGGAIEPRYEKQVKETINRLITGNHVKMLGHVEQPVLLDIYQAASVLAMSSIEETAPMAIAQAMAAGKPVVATRVGGIPWMVDNGLTGYLVDSGDIQGLAAHLIELLSDRKKRIQMGDAAKKAAWQRFAADNVSEQTIQAYYQMINGVKKKPSA
jgi:glycosyltransferase involved in cell wall biosynthesis